MLLIQVIFGSKLDTLYCRDVAYNNDLKELRLNGFKDDFTSFDVGLNFIKGVHNWIGVDVSLVTFNGEQWKPKVKSSDLKESIIPSSFPVKMGFLNVSYLSNISTKDYDLSFSLFQFTSPIVFNVTKFGFHKSVIADQKYWYYRPEIGIGWNCFSIYYSYNIAFQNTAASFAQRHLVNLRIAIHIAKF